MTRYEENERRKQMKLTDKPTQKQLDFIADIEEAIGEKFKGETREEASGWIDEHIDQYRLLTADDWVLKKGYF